MAEIDAVVAGYAPSVLTTKARADLCCRRDQTILTARKEDHEKNLRLPVIATLQVRGVK
jgi:hypothetical protein